MSLTLSKKKRQLKKEQKLQAHRDALAAETGILFSSDLKSDEKDRFPFLKYVINAIILFCGTFGSLYCLVSAFQIELTIVPLVTTCIISALVLSFMYVSYRAKVITYLFILAGAIYAATRYFVVVNSGISAIWNNILKFTNANAGLPFLREYTIYYNDEFSAMSIAICVLAVGHMVLLNIDVSEKMSLRGTFMLTFPIAQFGMYFNFASAKSAMLCVATSWVLVAGIKMTNGYNGLSHTLETEASVKEHRHKYGFITDSVNVSRIATIWLCFMLSVTAFVFTIVPGEGFEVNLPTNAVKASTERVVKNFLAYGFSSMYSRDREASEPGQLSNLANIAFDGRTDIRVDFVNYRVDRTYLRNFVGYNYDSGSLKWTANESTGAEEKLYNLTAELLEYDFNHKQLVCQSWHRFDIQLTDSTLMSTALNVPYYSKINGEKYKFNSSGSVSLTDSSTAFDIQTYTAFTLDSQMADYSVLLDEIDDKVLKEEYETLMAEMKEDAYSNALYVPEGNISAIENFCTTYGISADSKDPIKDVITALENNFEYTLSPGKVPYREDYINYFLNANQKGYCQHFATAATMIFRYLGIPARYAEGYAVDIEDFYNAAMLSDEKADEWIDTIYRTDTIVSRVNIPDSSGHAWVEVFEDGAGWVTVEATTATATEQTQGGLLTALFGGRNRNTNGGAITEIVNKIDINRTKQRLIILGIIALLIVFILYIERMAKAVITRHLSFRTDNEKKNTGNRYKHLYSVWQFANGKEDVWLSYKEFADIMADYNLQGYDKDKFCTEFERLLFSGSDTEGENNTELCETMNNCRKQIIKAMKMQKKLSYYLTRFMW